MIWFVGTAAMLVLVIVFCLVRSLRSEKEIAPYVTQCLFWLLIPLVSNMVIALSNKVAVLEFCFTVYFVSSTILLYYYNLFMIKYCHFEHYRPLLNKILLALTAVDAVSVASNYIFKHTFDISIGDVGTHDGIPGIPGALGMDNVVFTSLWYHKIHLAVAGLFVLLPLAMITVRFFKSSKLYRDRYAGILIAYVFSIFWESFHVFINDPVDQSVIGISVCGIFIYIYAIEYIPSVLMDEMKTTVIATVSDGVLFFDENRKCIYVNPAARMQLGIGNNESAKVGFGKLHELTGEDPLESGNYISKKMTCKKVEGDEEYIYDIEFHKLHDLQGKLIGSFAKIQDTTERTKRENLNKFLATHDKLTGIYNIDRFYEEVRKVLTDNPDKKFYIVTSDIKDFKLINDRFGREFADKLLIRTAELFKEFVTDDLTRYGRIGSDKFGCLIESSRFDEQIFKSAIQEVGNLGSDKVVPIIIHAGIYEIEDKNMPVAAMLDRSFIAIAGIKNDADRRIAYYEEHAREEMLWSQKVTEQIDSAIQSGQIVPYLQAQVSREGKVVGAEVLVRWIHPVEGFMPPGKFLGILEKNGMIAKIDRYIWECACRILKRWEEEGRPDLYLSVNISPKDFYIMDVPKEIIGLADKYKLDKNRLRLEITESIMMDDVDEKLKTIDKLRDAGFIVEMDDFGSGYSSLNMLKDMPVDVLKLDMVFLKDTAANERTKKIMSLIINLAKSLNIPVIAEGVETVEQVDLLTEMGCDYFQGYYFARPVSLDEYEQKTLNAS